MFLNRHFEHLPLAQRRGRYKPIDDRYFIRLPSRVGTRGQGLDRLALPGCD
jgi:hypothetical protein